MYMQVPSRQRLSWCRLRLMLVVTILPAFFFGFGLFSLGTAHANSSTSHISQRSQVIVNSAVKHDVSPPLDTITPVHTAQTGQRSLRPLPKLQRGVPNGLESAVQP